MARKQFSSNGNVNSSLIELILAEYNVLKTEIQNRSIIQNTILGVHITAITYILGAMLSKSGGHWVNFLIPVEAALFGLWWIDHALVITDIGSYIGRFIEPKLAKLVKQDQVMNWETTYMKGITLPDIKRTVTFTRLIFITFGFPAVLSILVSSILIVVDISRQFSLIPGELELPVAAVYSEFSIWIAIGLLAVNLVLFSVFYSMYRYYLKIIYKFKTICDIS